MRPPLTLAPALPLSLLGELLISLREQRGMTQQELAERLGTHQEVVSRMEAVSYRTASLERVNKVARALEAAVVIQVEAP